MMARPMPGGRMDRQHRREIKEALRALVRVVMYGSDLASIRQGVVMSHALDVLDASDHDRKPVPWDRFEPARPSPPTAAHIAKVASDMGVPLEEASATFAKIQAIGGVHVNSRYQVQMRPNADGTWVHLSIKRIDQDAVHDWRDLQRIKNDLVGPECEGCEIYPAESRLVDTSNQYHLWVCTDPAFRWPWGFPDRSVLPASEGPAGQRPFEGDTTHDG